MSNYVLSQAAKARECLVPVKSKAAYSKVYEDFQEWRRENSVNGVDENILLAFFEDLSHKYSPNTLWPKLSMLRKVRVTVLAILAVVATALASVTWEGDCHCWDEFYKFSKNGVYFCKGIKHNRVFMCNDVKPPICKCEVDGHIISLDLGETNCLSVVQGLAGVWCHNKKDFEKYFSTHPEHDITGTY
ncbi:hypothetical protein Zmor_019266 [Zophobas morio]|uniref:Uncharacterized protein n=1 Tax=Zophobas morio TaxID=2755281 RepID=A0AA38I1J6_9CUCU|nr:hypothetical protein Zmor_019266 [Zophobas morio]